MILIPATRPIYVAVDPVDFRRSFDVLVEIARSQLGLDALRSAVVLFVNRDRSRCKIVFHDGTGMVILYKRLDAGRFTRPTVTLVGDRSVRVAVSELAMLLTGVVHTQK
jgi:transposase